MKTPLDQLADEMRAVRAQMKELAQTKGKPLILESLQPLFDLGVASVSWKQFTPYFNDGDPCEFSVHDPSVFHPEFDPDGGDYENGFYDSWTLRYLLEENQLDTDLPPDSVTSITETLSAIGRTITDEAVEPFMEDLFGDHVEVLVHSDGTFVVEEYYHD
jgi:hypothetical protein